MTTLLRAVLLALAAALPSAGWTQAYPDKPVSIVLPIGGGGGTDILARLIAARLGTLWKQSVVIDYKIGGQGSIAGKYVARSRPDGATILLAAAGNITISPLISDLGYDPQKELLPITILASAPYVLVINPDKVSADSIKSFVDLAKAKPGTISWGSSTIGSPDHLAGELFQLMTGTKLNHVPYKQAGQAIVDLLGGHIGAGFLTIPSTLQHIQRGQMRALGVSDTSRSSLLPAVPTIEEAGVSGYTMLTWYGMFVPLGTSPAIIQKVAEDSAIALKQEDVRKKLADLGFDPKALPPSEVGAFIKAEVVKYGKVVSATGIREKLAP